MQRIVISASRRTDIPSFYMPWFMQQIEQGYFDVRHPFSGKSARVPAKADQIHTIVFWSKNFGPFLEGGFDRRLIEGGYHLFFNFTINSANPLLEPAVPPIEARLAQLAQLVDRFGPAAVQWRFDPICYYEDAAGREAHNLGQFPLIARQVAGLGIQTCITSFVDLYKKVRQRSAQAGLSFIDPPLGHKINQIVSMTRLLRPLGIQLQLCCEHELLAALPKDAQVVGAACIPNHKLAELYGEDLSLAKDAGQRVSAGCGCRVSRDIGSYQLHPCPHHCLFCYANPGPPAANAAVMGATP
jgi:hypothetical protein